MKKEYTVRIEAYLKSKNLSESLLREVKEHFVSQIDAEMHEKNIDFETAFLNVKLAWQKDLQMVKADFFSFKKVAKIEKHLIQTQFNLIFRNACVFAVLMTLLSGQFPEYFSFLLFGIFIIMIGFYWVAFFQKKITFLQILQMNFHPLVFRLLLLNCCIGFGVLSIINYFLPNAADFKYLARDFGVFLGSSIQIQLLYFQMKKVKVLI